MNDPVVPNPWTALRQFTDARIALGRVGASLPTREVLQFDLAHAHARDAVHSALDVTALTATLRLEGWLTCSVESRAPDRARYLLRPDLGRRLHPDSLTRRSCEAAAVDIAFVIADGLSAVAALRHGVPLLAQIRALLSPDWRLAPITIATLARVALGDEIGARLRSRLVVMLIGERPGLSAPDSLGAYLTYEPRLGRTDAERNCVSNIRPAGLSYQFAAQKIVWLIAQALKRQLTGIDLKDESDLTLLPG